MNAHGLDTHIRAHTQMWRFFFYINLSTLQFPNSIFSSGINWFFFWAFRCTSFLSLQFLLLLFVFCMFFFYYLLAFAVRLLQQQSRTETVQRLYAINVNHLSASTFRSFLMPWIKFEAINYILNEITVSCDILFVVFSLCIRIHVQICQSQNVCKTNL